MSPAYDFAAAPDVPYFTPAQVPVAGTGRPVKDSTKPLAKLFQPLKIRGVEFQNRLWVAPMDLSSSDVRDGMMNLWNITSLASKIVYGPGLTIIEAAAVTPEGRVTVHDVGFWSDAHAVPIRQLAEFTHSQGQKLGIQLGHCGRKGTMAPIWHAGHEVVPSSRGGWSDDLVAPSAVGYPPSVGEEGAVPHALTKEEIKTLVVKWAEAAKRAVDAGVDVIELHGAHGFLIHNFLSPVSNKRTDEYGGSLENRARFLFEVADAIRGVIPSTTPLFLRVSATDWLDKVLPNEPSWTLDETIKLANLLPEHGIDLIDVSSGGTDPGQKIEFIGGPAYQAHLAEAIKKSVGDRLLVAAVGGITTGSIAEEVLQKGQADVALVGKASLLNPAFVLDFAKDLEVDVKIPHQGDWVVHGRKSMWRWVDSA
ncbi:FMN-linked oxidoreductase [Epithele typhae]|uniref:FMN-linked oxidoreductase n=1 Tax=Epithele typhae TaxID=378194 RepID=UPI002007B967|nr:FMN-linked oxidoreductase [Epithele typhae]KAH9939053.1 FMN-linked oxidoreductase [Epithele typhae]